MYKIDIRTVVTAADREAAFSIRERVFVAEQQVPLAAEFDDHDNSATHLLALADGAPVGTLRWRQVAAGTAKIERVAVRKAYRGRRIGEALLHACLTQIRATGLREIILHAQVQAQPFYARLGFRPEGGTFLEDGIEHIAMRLGLEAKA